MIQKSEGTLRFIALRKDRSRSERMTRVEVPYLDVIEAIERTAKPMFLKDVSADE
jgi:hypothetical protein